jgi:hypothetical protein
MAPHEVRGSNDIQKRREVRAATVARNILRSSAVRAPLVTTSSDLVSSTASSRDYLLQSMLCLRLLCFMPTTYTIYANN